MEHTTTEWHPQDEITRLRAELELAKAEIERRKDDPVTRLHNICEAIAEEADGSEFSREEWERIDAENLSLRKQLAARDLVIRDLTVAKAALEKIESYTTEPWSSIASEALAKIGEE